MDFRESLSAQLPPSRPDEPARLRQDILDELNDHLVCSYHREILRARIHRSRGIESSNNSAIRLRWLSSSGSMR